MNFLQFEKYLSDQCKKHNVEFVVSQKTRVFYQDTTCNGFFESHYPINYSFESITNGIFPQLLEDNHSLNPVLAAAKGGKTDIEFYSLLAHEYSHLCQFFEKSKYWPTKQNFEDWESIFSTTPTPNHQIAWEKIVMVEADCEMRVIQLINDLSLEIDTTKYAQAANSYLYFYTWCLKNKKWYTTAPYEIPAIVNLMPNTLLASPEEYTKIILNDELNSLFDRCSS